MTKIILSGAGGQMGCTLKRIISERNDYIVVAGISKNSKGVGNFPIFNSPDEINVDADVIIDFSNPALLDSLLSFAIRQKMPIVICTTGFSDEQINKIKDASKLIPIFFSGNMSIGVNLLIELAKKAALALGSNVDIEIIEKHHNKKIDAPSGTALMIANAINSVNGQNLNYVYERHSKRATRSHSEIGIHSIRCGTMVGEHDVIFAGKDEVLTLSHTAQSKGIFAVGAINAAIFLLSKPAGLYNMSDLLK